MMSDRDEIERLNAEIAGLRDLHHRLDKQHLATCEKLAAAKKELERWRSEAPIQIDKIDTERKEIAHKLAAAEGERDNACVHLALALDLRDTLRARLAAAEKERDDAREYIDSTAHKIHERLLRRLAAAEDEVERLRPDAEMWRLAHECASAGDKSVVESLRAKGERLREERDGYAGDLRAIVDRMNALGYPNHPEYPNDDEIIRRLGEMSYRLAAAEKERDECERALHRLAKEGGVPDEGPDENVNAVLARLAAAKKELDEARAVIDEAAEMCGMRQSVDGGRYVHLHDGLTTLHTKLAAALKSAEEMTAAYMEQAGELAAAEKEVASYEELEAHLDPSGVGLDDLVQHLRSDIERLREERDEAVSAELDTTKTLDAARDEVESLREKLAAVCDLCDRTAAENAGHKAKLAAAEGLLRRARRLLPKECWMLLEDIDAHLAGKEK